MTIVLASFTKVDVAWEIQITHLEIPSQLDSIISLMENDSFSDNRRPSNHYYSY